MQKYVTFLILFLGINLRILAQTQDLIQLISDKATYEIGEKAVLIARPVIAPASSKLEYAYVISLNGQQLSSYAVSSSVAFSVSTPLSVLGENTWSITLFAQDKVSARRLNEMIAFYLSINAELNDQLRNEVDQNRIQVIQGQIQRNQSLIDNARTELTVGMKFIGSAFKSFQVVSSSLKIPGILGQPTLSVTLDHANGRYNLGESAKVKMKLSGPLRMGFEAAEFEFYGVLDTQNILVKNDLAPGEVEFTTAAFNVSDLGSRNFTGTVTYRPKGQAEALGIAYDSASTKIKEFIQLKGQTSDQKTKVYYQSLIEDFSKAISSLKVIKNLFHKFREPVVVNIKVKDPNAIPGLDLVQVGGATQVTEGGATAEVKLRLNSMPDSPVTMYFATGTQLNAVSNLTFDDNNWDIYQTVVVFAPDDGLLEGPQTEEFRAYTFGGGYDNQQVSINVDIADGPNPYHGISIGGDSICAIKGKRLVCWGDGDNYLLATGTTSDLLVPTVVSNLTSVQSISSSYFHRCALNGGSVYCWGLNNKGQLGLGFTSASVANPTKIPSLDVGVTDIKVGLEHSCAIKNGKVYCWGENSQYQIGNGTSVDQYSPVLVTLPADAVYLSMGGEDTCAVLSAGAVYCWGYNGSGQHATGNTTLHQTPTLATLIPAGVHPITSNHWSATRCFSHGNGLRCFGANDYRQVGSGGSATLYSSPQDVLGFTSAPSSFSSSDYAHTCAVEGGVAYCWGAVGSINLGTLGNGSQAGSATRVVVSGLVAPVLEVEASGNSSCVIDSAGMKCWGSSSFLGNGTGINSATPVSVLNPIF